MNKLFGIIIFLSLFLAKTSITQSTNDNDISALLTNNSDSLFKEHNNKIDIYYYNQHQIKLLNKELEPKIKYQNQSIISINKNEREIERLKININNNNDSLKKYYEERVQLFKKKIRKKDSSRFIKDTIRVFNHMTPFLNHIKEDCTKINSFKESIKAINKSDSVLLKVIKLYREKISKFNDPKLKEDYTKSKNHLEKFYTKHKGEIKFNYKNQNYIGFIADLSKHDIGLHLNYQNVPDKTAQKFINIRNIKSTLEQSGKEVLMITNGGMYTPQNNPEGLLIANHKTLEPIDLEPPKKQMLNFYMMPNGVFYINNNKAYIEESKNYNKKYRTKKINPKEATQSGPMLIINNEHHPAFNHGSRSKKLRSGVGVMKDGRVIFIISNKSITNFHDFGTIFKDLFGCENALFLDGVISKMYLKKNSPLTLDGNFGPIISVTEK